MLAIRHGLDRQAIGRIMMNRMSSQELHEHLGIMKMVEVFIVRRWYLIRQHDNSKFSHYLDSGQQLYGTLDVVCKGIENGYR